MRERLLYFDDCPSWRQAAKHLEHLANEFDLDIDLELVDTPEAADRLRFHGSPSILVDGPAGCPTLEQTRTAMQQRRIRS